MSTNTSIYIVLSKTGTLLSRAITLVTGDKFCHASISFDTTLKEMYTFGRKWGYLPFPGEYTIESTNHGTFKQFSNSEILIIKINTDTHKQYMLKRHLNNMYRHRNKYGFNYIGLILAGAGIRFKYKNRYYCSEFVRNVLVKYNIIDMPTNKIIRPIEFLDMQNIEIVYIGNLRNYAEL